jgi:1-acyl-sn-glycerol-3-phosphate acyltransferase
VTTGRAVTSGCHHLPAPRAACVAGCVTPAADAVGLVRTWWRLAALAAVVAVLVPPVLLVMGLPGYGRAHRRAWLLQWLCRRVLTAAGVTLAVTGTVRSGAGLVVANHSSWLDVLALTAGAPMVPVAKSEVQEWPLVGAVARHSGAVFLRRRMFRDLPEAVDAMTLLLRQGNRVQVFPEATTRCGRAVGEFHRAAFQAALNAAVVVQPAAVRVSQGTVPTTATAFVGDDTLAGVVWRTLRMRDVVVELQWLRPIPAIAGSGRAPVDRAVVARLAENAVARALRQDVVLRRRRATDRPPVAGWLPAAVRVSR